MTQKKRNYSEITPAISELAAKCVEKSTIDQALYKKHEVYRGLRDLKGRGVVAGLTEISDIIAKKTVNGEKTPCDGELYYRGYSIFDIISGAVREKRFAFEEITYLLLFGELPTQSQLDSFCRLLAGYRSLPNSFTRDIIMKAPSVNLMNSLARSVLTLYSYDTNAEDLSIDNVVRQSIQLIAMFPMLSIYSYQAYSYFKNDSTSLFIHDPDPALSTAENILKMLRPDGKYTPTEAHLLDISLVLHAEHGGGNNSSFTTHVVTSSGTDTYSAIAAALCSLKGPKHGGANIKVREMFADIKKHISDWEDEDELCSYLSQILDKQAFDKTGLIYGMGHAVYSISDPRAVVLKSCLADLAREKGRERELALYNSVERLAPELIAERRAIYKGVSANVDFYSGLVYEMLDIPCELFTPLFAIARVSGWCAHRTEELINGNKIIRPAYKTVGSHREYIALGKRDGEND